MKPTPTASATAWRATATPWLSFSVITTPPAPSSQIATAATAQPIDACGFAATATNGLPSASAAQGKRTFRWAFNAAETGFDPAQISDVYSRVIASNIFEAPLTYDFLARPMKLKPRAAAALPEIKEPALVFEFGQRPEAIRRDGSRVTGRLHGDAKLADAIEALL